MATSLGLRSSERATDKDAAAHNMSIAHESQKSGCPDANAQKIHISFDQRWGAGTSSDNGISSAEFASKLKRHFNLSDEESHKAAMAARHFKPDSLLLHQSSFQIRPSLWDRLHKKLLGASAALSNTAGLAGPAHRT